MALRSYWTNITDSFQTLVQGLRLTGRHLARARKSKTTTAIAQPGYFAGQRGITTIQFPHEFVPVPDNGRYKLHNEIDDCIVCDKCAVICPVNCITIEPIRSPEEIGKTSDGTSKRIYAAKFDIDMGKCCFCGLCTTVCPTECLTMTSTYDFSVLDIREHNFPFATMSAEEITEKKKTWENHQATKGAFPPVQKPAAPGAAPKPVFKPKIKPPGSPS